MRFGVPMFRVVALLVIAWMAIDVICYRGFWDAKPDQESRATLERLIRAGEQCKAINKSFTKDGRAFAATEFRGGNSATDRLRKAAMTVEADQFNHEFSLLNYLAFELAKNRVNGHSRSLERMYQTNVTAPGMALAETR